MGKEGKEEVKGRLRHIDVSSGSRKCYTAFEQNVRWRDGLGDGQVGETGEERGFVAVGRIRCKQREVGWRAALLANRDYHLLSGA